MCRVQAVVHLASVPERSMMMKVLDKLVPQDGLLHDRGHPAAWRVDVRVERRGRFDNHCSTHLLPAPDGAQQALAELNGRSLLSAAVCPADRSALRPSAAPPGVRAAAV